MEDRNRILIVDDNAMNVDILERLLRKKYELKSAADGESALALIPEFRPDVVLLDIMMPGMDGYQVCQRIKESPIGDLTQVVLVSGKASAGERVKGYDVGADDYVIKPFDHDELLSKVRVHCRLRDAHVNLSRAKDELEIYNAELENLVAERTHEVVAVRDMTVFALAELAESRDQETGRHLVRIRSYSQILAEELQMLQRPGYEVDDAFLADLYRASPLHDIGKVGVPDAILQKPGKLNDAEIRVMRQHVEFGAATLERAMGRGHAGEFLQMAAGVARFHHERWDGSGYLAGLAGTDIPLAARIVALADVFDALTSRRVYKDSMSVEETCEMIRSDSGAHFDPTVVAAFDAGISRFLEVVAEHAVSIEAASDLSPARLVEVS